jgi:hypothetical protein
MADFGTFVIPVFDKMAKPAAEPKLIPIVLAGVSVWDSATADALES